MTILDADNRCFQLGTVAVTVIAQYGSYSVLNCLSPSGAEHHHDAMLASIGDEQENQFIKDLAREKNPTFDFVMLGAFGRSNNGDKWQWMDGKPHARPGCSTELG
ncbi:hypothetical protein ANCDUO_11364 [Ancylostoma duodenale]|uniref:C-type lectin domain-containing protein n=1 Tax=Ancylostoma duodenale TaxID=51022 RepID=A0A0C2CP05_9BILA|nr:hypothetical protein ANCDUO_11364 [Ancylostoma duodenale]